ncbi:MULTISPECIES: hypothetical protein [unclassified Acinetobacter]|uniref:hypothetical protein n=1 Tax=unclassified Acinetobacter TaxID=196816 RepID=UPI000B2B4702|nr:MULTISPECIES: hypothetical protein [unclassified Acinetobacter]
MKYIMFRKEINDLVELIPVIFPNKLVHKDVADALQKEVLKDCTIHSAGSISPLNLLPEGRSETLGAESNPETDEHVIKMNDYGAGYLW